MIQDLRAFMPKKGIGGTTIFCSDCDSLCSHERIMTLLKNGVMEDSVKMTGEFLHEAGTRWLKILLQKHKRSVFRK